MLKNPETPGLQSLAKVQSSAFLVILALLIVLTLAGSAYALVAVPWYQSVTGQGKVIMYSPMERVQQVDAQIPGRLEKWLVMEGQAVKKGQKLGLLRDIDSKFLDPLQVERTNQMVQSYRLKQQLNVERLETLSQQRQAILKARQAALPASQQRIEQSRQRLNQNRQVVTLAKQNLQTDRLQFDRIRTLEEQGLRSRRDFELIQQALVKSQTELQRSQLSLDLSQRDISVAELEYSRLEAQFQNDLAKVEESLLKTQEQLAEVQAQIAKLDIEQSSLQQRRLQQWILAPRDGRVVRLLKLGEGETVKAGDALCQVMPSVEDPAVEITISDFDAPLVRVGQKVRLTFDGFPAIPFTALPWAEVGTFGGVVSVVDAVDDGQSRFRLLVTPDPHADDIPWPKLSEQGARYPLRPGSRAQAWVMMDKPVPLYWELWRRLNAFPPVPLGKDDEKDKEKPFAPKPVFKR